MRKDPRNMVSEETPEAERALFARCADEVETEYEMGGLAGGLYEDFAWDVMQKYLAALSPQPRPKPAKGRASLNHALSYGKKLKSFSRDYHCLNQRLACH